jgi:MFS transporter, ACS family, glucarate transporter
VVFVLILGSYLKSLGVVSGGPLGLMVSLPLFGGAAGGIFGGYANDWAINRFPNRRWGRAAVGGTGLAIGGTLVMIAVSSSDPMTVAIGLMIARFFVDWSQPTVWGTCTDLGGKYSATVFGMSNMMGNMGAFLTPFAVGLLLDYFSVLTIVDGVSVRQTDYVPAFVMCAGMMWAAAACWLMIDCTSTIIPEPEET